MDSNIKILIGARGIVSRWIASVGVLTIFILLFCPSSSRAEEVFVPEYKIKARFIYNFAKFVDWPTNAFSSADSPFVIGILGSDPFGTLLDQVVQSGNIAGRRIEVRRFTRVEEAQPCHVLFVGRSETEHLAAIFKQLKGKSILTVGESSGFLDEGGMINLILEQMSVTFQIDVAAAEAAHLSISSKLLDLATNVRHKPAGVGR